MSEKPRKSLATNSSMISNFRRCRSLQRDQTDGGRYWNDNSMATLIGTSQGSLSSQYQSFADYNREFVVDVVHSDEESTTCTMDVLNEFLSNNLEHSDVESECSVADIPSTTRKNEVRKRLKCGYGSVFEQIRTLPRASAIFKPNLIRLMSSPTSTSASSDISLLDRSSREMSSLTEQRNKNFQLISKWTDEGRYSRVKAMTIASTLFSSKVTESEMRAEFKSVKEKYAYKKFCWELEDKLQTVTRCNKSLGEKTLRKMWHLYALYTMALSDQIWDEGNAKSDITTRAIAYLVKRAVAGPDFLEDWNRSGISKSGGALRADSSKSAPLLKPVAAVESMNPVLAAILNDPIHGFLIVYGRFVGTGKVDNVDKLKKLEFNQIAEDFFEKIVEPPLDKEEMEALVARQSHISSNSTRSTVKSVVSNSLTRLPLAGSSANTVDTSSSKITTWDNLSQKAESLVSTRTQVEVPTEVKPDEVIIPAEGEQITATSSNSGAAPNAIKSLQRKMQLMDRKKRICLGGCRYDVLPQVAKEIGFEVVTENDLWNINWSDSPLAAEKIMDMRRIQDTHSVFWGLSAPLQKTNHFPGMYEICRKDRLGRNLNRLKKMFPGDYSFFPPTWDLPTEQADLLAYSRKRKNATFIVKPECGCQGKGIFLIRNLKNLYPFAKCVCQLYVPHPFLIDGYKYDQRIYVLITCVDPLRLYIYEEGIARFATVKYNVATDDNLEVVYMHLTNYSLNKFSESYVPDGDGSKRKLSVVYDWMQENGFDVPALQRDIDEIVIKTILCAVPTLKHNYRTSFPKRDRGCSCFELLGFDILIDRHLKPLLLEVNHSPSFNLDLPVDTEVKTELLKDLLNMIYLGDELSPPVPKKPSPPPPPPPPPPKRKGGRVKKKVEEPPPPETNVIVDMPGYPKALVRQFQHEMDSRGKFRLIYSSDRPGKFSKLLEENYLGYVAQECSSSSSSKRRNSQVVYTPGDESDYWNEPATTSTVKTTKSGQPYVETKVVTPPLPLQEFQRFRERAESEVSITSRVHHHSRAQSKSRSRKRSESIGNNSASAVVRRRHSQSKRRDKEKDTIRDLEVDTSSNVSSHRSWILGR